LKILIDSSNLCFIEMGAAKSVLFKEGKDLDAKNWPFFINVLMSRVHNIFSTYNEDEIIFCWEGKNSTKRRKSIYSEYKGNRGKAKEEVSYQLLMEFLPKFQELLKSYPCKSMIIDECEADDVIYALAEELHKENGVVIISTDNDLSQIREKFGENVSMYNPVRKQFIVKYNVVLNKAIVGDKGDNIPGISRIGEKTFEKMIADENFMEEVLNKGNNRKIMEQFLEIVDLSKLPESLKINVLNEYKKEPYSFNPDTVEQFFWDNKCKEQLSKWGTTKTKIVK